VRNKPPRNSFTVLYKQLIESGSVLDKRDCCCPGISDEVLQHIGVHKPLKHQDGSNRNIYKVRGHITTSQNSVPLFLQGKAICLQGKATVVFGSCDMSMTCLRYFN
jgi:hypothetical protein